jgi:hypothetical protein
VLDLFGSYGLTGTLPAELGQLHSLRVMNLEEVAFVGGPIPATFGGLKNLEELNLGEMALEGPIPTALGNLTATLMLDLSRNALSGPIPAELGNLTSTLMLDLSQNLLTGTIPAEIGKLTHLTRLCLHANALSGEIPPSLADLENLNAPDNHWHTCNLGGNEGITALDYNSLHASDAGLVAFLDEKDPTWDETQTVAPTNLHMAALDAAASTWPGRRCATPRMEAITRCSPRLSRAGRITRRAKPSPRRPA